MIKAFKFKANKLSLVKFKAFKTERLEFESFKSWDSPSFNWGVIQKSIGTILLIIFALNLFKLITNFIVVFAREKEKEMRVSVTIFVTTALECK